MATLFTKSIYRSGFAKVALLGLMAFCGVGRKLQILGRSHRSIAIREVNPGRVAGGAGDRDTGSEIGTDHDHIRHGDAQRAGNVLQQTGAGAREE